jgi:phage shock protein PspC (stress-responsive transcriptional regulator)
MMEPKKLYRSKTNRMLCGVCGGLGEYLNIDPTIIRLLAVLIGLTGGGVVAYIIAAIVIPDEY